MRYTVHLSYVFIALLIGVGIGFNLTPEYAQMKNEKNSPSMSLGASDRYIDLRYIDGMISHHLSAIYMAEQAKKYSVRTEIQNLSSAIIAADTVGIQTLYDQKLTWYNNARKISRFDRVQLGSGDEQFDLRFLNALIAHHEEAIAVAKDIQTKSTRSEVLNTASSVIRGLAESIKTLTSWRSAWYGIN